MSSIENNEKNAGYFNLEDQELLEQGVPSDLRLSVSENVHFQRAGRELWEDETPYPPKEAAKHTGEYNMNNGVIVLVDRNGGSWVAGDSPKARKALERAGYTLNADMNVPFSNGELLNEHKHTSSMESQQNHWKRIKALARRDWEEADAK